MLMRLLRKLFIKDYQDTESVIIRNKYGVVISIYGIIANVFLSTVKLVFGLLANSFSIIGDSINNISDSANSIVSLVGFKMAGKPADKKHPFGHARIENVAGLIISTVIVVIGLILMATGVMAIIDFVKASGNVLPLPVDWWTISILIISIFVKVLLTGDNYWTGKTINSLTLKATSRDALNDILVTTGLLISTIIMMCLQINIDGFMTVFVACFILYSGIRSVFDTSHPLIGEQNSQEEVQEVINIAKSFGEVIGVHDVIVHNYGGDHRFITLHLELDSKMDVFKWHQLACDVESKIEEKFPGSKVNIHVDPVDKNNPLLKQYTKLIKDYIKDNNLDGYSVHDIRAYNNHKDELVVHFELLIPYCKKTRKKEIDMYHNQTIKNFSSIIESTTNQSIIIDIKIDHPMS